MDYMHLIYVFFISLISSSSINAQQSYTKAPTCASPDNSTSDLGYTCNGITPICQAYLTFRSQPPFTSVSSISNLLAADPSQLSRLNSVPEDATFDTNQMVLVPVNCSCSGQYYQVNTSYVVQAQDTTFLAISNNTFQGLSTCQALLAQNNNRTTINLYPGMRLIVPLRCACPTKNQTGVGVNYLLSYIVSSGQYVSLVSNKFGADTGRTLEANRLSEYDAVIYPFTTLLVPLRNPPSSYQILNPPPPPSNAHSSKKKSNKISVYVVAGVGGLAVLIVIVAIIFCKRKKIFDIIFCKSKKKLDPVSASECSATQEVEAKSEFLKKFDPVSASESSGIQEVEAKSEFLEKFDPVSASESSAIQEVEAKSEFLGSVSSIAQSLKDYTFDELQSTTENFSPSCLIRGSVYRGKINGDFVAIKKIGRDASKEIDLLSKMNHFNLISLSGVCYDDRFWYLVYEYAVNGPLCDWIYTKNSNQKFLTWSQRVQIAFDVATGLNYLHSHFSRPYVHRDIKSSNILLDSDFRAKITNFNLEMLAEYLEEDMTSPKLDVYSFGVLMLEIITGKEVSLLYEGVNTDLSEVLIPTFHAEDGMENLRRLMDSSLGDYPADLTLSVVRLIERCIKKNLSERPDMNDIVENLKRTLNRSLVLGFSISASG